MTKFRRTTKGRPKKFHRGPRLPTLPPPTDDRAVVIVAYVRSNIRMILEGKILFFGIPLSFFDPDDGRRLTITILKRIAADPIGLVDVHNLARFARWRLAHEAMCELILEY